MKVIACVTTRNEERNIVRFCQGYSWADQVLVADGGSDDGTVELAEAEGAWVRTFARKVWFNADTWRNPVGPHVNFLIDWAREERADWIIFDDCDCSPNKLLKADGRIQLACALKPVVLAVRLYLWGEDHHFPRLAQPLGAGRWTPSLWAWRPDLIDIRALNKHPGHVSFNTEFPADGRWAEIMPPYCLLHRPWPDEEEVQRKMAFREGMGQPFEHPLKFGGALERLPEWAHD